MLKKNLINLPFCDGEHRKFGGQTFAGILKDFSFETFNAPKRLSIYCLRKAKYELENFGKKVKQIFYYSFKY